MGYPMTYVRVLARNNLRGDYGRDASVDDGRGFIRGDLRRLEADQRDELHLEMYARKAGVTPGQAKMVLDAFFEGTYWSDGLAGTDALTRYRQYVQKLGHNP